MKNHQIIKKIQKLFSKKIKPIFLHEPDIDLNDIKNVSLALKQKKISSHASITLDFEKKLKSYTKSKYVVSTINGTSALHLALLSLKIKSHEEILMPSLNYIASANACLYLGAVPHFIETKRDNLNIDVEYLEKYLNFITKQKNNKCFNVKTKRYIRAIIVPHLFGHIYEIEKIKKISKKYNLFFIEDAAEALGSFYKRKHAGTFGDIGILSFNGNKIISSGSGGAIITNNKKLALEALKLSTISKKSHTWKYEYDELGYNYRLPSINAALGISQLKKLNFFIKLKRNLYKKYKDFFEKEYIFDLIKEPKNCRSNYWLQTVILKNNYKINHKIFKSLFSHKIYARPIWRPLHLSNHLKKFPKMRLKNTEDIAKRIINLPSSSFLFKKNSQL